MPSYLVAVLNNTSDDLTYKNVDKNEQLEIKAKDPQSMEPNEYIPYKNPIDQVIPNEEGHIEVSFGKGVQRFYNRDGKLWRSYLADHEPDERWTSTLVCSLESGEHYEFLFYKKNGNTALDVKKVTVESKNVGGHIINVASNVIATISTIILDIVL